MFAAICLHDEFITKWFFISRAGNFWILYYSNRLSVFYEAMALLYADSVEEKYFIEEMEYLSKQFYEKQSMLFLLCFALLSYDKEKSSKNVIKSIWLKK